MRDAPHGHFVKNSLTIFGSGLGQGFAAEPDLLSRQLQEKAGGVAPAGLFS
jgi:hypothetical protein